MDEGGNFGDVAGYSAPSFLAFNSDGRYRSGGQPIGPETISFTSPFSLVCLRAGAPSPQTGSITLTAFDGGTQVGEQMVAATAALQRLCPVPPQITSVRLSFTTAWLVVDNLIYGPMASPAGR